jgi:hypothetical protein
LYAYNNPTDTALFNTVFLSQKVFNLSQNTYDNVRIGKFTDIELTPYYGYGTDSLRNLVYCYLKEQGDGYSPGYPSQGMVLLNHPTGSSVLYNLESSGAFDGDPRGSTQYYNYLQGLWKDGSPITYGGTGFGGTAVTNMMFTGYPEADSGWVQPNSERRRSVISTGNTTLSPGDFVCFDLAFPYAWVPGNYSYTAPLGHLRRFTDRIQEFYNSQNYACEVQTVDIPTLTSVETPVQVYPNPNNGTFTVSLPNDFHANFEIEIYNTLGQKIFHREKLKALEQVEVKNFSGLGFYVIKRNKREISRGMLSIYR